MAAKMAGEALRCPGCGRTAQEGHSENCVWGEIAVLELAMARHLRTLAHYVHQLESYFEQFRGDEPSEIFVQGDVSRLATLTDTRMMGDESDYFYADKN